MQVSEIMTRDCQVIDPNSSIHEAAMRMRDENIGALPVGENDRLIGMVTDRDIVTRGIAAEGRSGTTSVRDVMSEKIFYIFDDDEIDQAARCMAEHQVRRLPVLNHDKRLIGMVSMADLAHAGEDAEKVALEGVSEPSSTSRR